MQNNAREMAARRLLASRKQRVFTRSTDVSFDDRIGLKTLKPFGSQGFGQALDGAKRVDQGQVWALIQRFTPCATLAAVTQGPSNQASPSR